MSLKDPRLWLTLISLLLVGWLFQRDLELSLPGPVARVHAQEPELVSPDGCRRCHGGPDRTMAAACNECHEEIAEQLALERGLHGTLTAAIDPEDCQACHPDHHGPAFDVIGERSFLLAGFESRERYDHSGLGYELGGRHDELRCVECHELADADVLSPQESRFLGLEQRCDTCHEDPHEGRILRACVECHGEVHPFEEIATFVHGAGFPLEGSHAPPACVDCHAPEGPYEVEVVAGREPPTDRDCADCHESPHADCFVAAAEGLAAERGEDRCEVCHPVLHASFGDSDPALSGALHPASGFRLDPPHAGLECVDCHPYADTVSFAERYPGRTEEACKACHEDPHAGQFAEGAFADGGCIGCHDAKAFVPAAFALEHHELSTFPLVESHAAVGCFECHPTPAGGKPADRVYRGLPRACVDCHADAHAEAFDAPALPLEHAGARGCARCHLETTFDEIPAERFDHGVWTPFALDGAHAQAACETCHERAADPDALGRRFGRVEEVYGVPAGTELRCVTCHPDVHDGGFDEPAHPLALEGRSGCARCHGTVSFEELSTEGFDHDLWTGYRLDGAHDRAECESCHPRAARPDADGRRFGRVRSAFGEPTDACRTCHTDVHGGAFERAGVPLTNVGRTGCARCHGTEAFDRLTPLDFDHGLWTGYALESVHERAECAACHPALDAPDAPDADGRKYEHALGTRCDACHEDVHAGQFGAPGASDCGACHPVADTWDDAPLFDHQRDSSYALDENHVDLECAACHVPWRVRGGEEVVRYRPLGVECADCHDDGRERR